MPEPLSPSPVTRWDPHWLPPYLSNGVIGLRLAAPGVGGGTTIVNGFAGLDPTDLVEGFAPAPFALGGDVEVDGIRASIARDAVRLVEQRYDFATAELTTTWEFVVGSTRARIEVLTFCSRSIPSIAAQEVAVETDRPADIAISAGIGQAGVPGWPEDPQQPPRGGPIEGVDGRMTWVSNGAVSRLGIAYATVPGGIRSPERTQSPRDQQGLFATTYRFRARRGRRHRVQLLTAVVPEMSHAQPAFQAGRLAALAVEIGWDALRAENRRLWAELWRSRIEIEGASRRWQAITDASLFYLLTSTHASALAACSLFGLAYWPDYHYYHGHVMWDIDTFTVPPLAVIAPDAARALLGYRARHLDTAQRNAQLHGRRGALYPWESCPLHGDEVTPGARPGLQDHVSLDVALAFAAYVDATGDRDYAARVAWPVIRSVCEYIESRVSAADGGYRWLRTLGPREHYEPVDDDAYVNLAARRTLEVGRRIAGSLGIEVPTRWADIGDGLRLPIHARGHLANHVGARLGEVKGGTPEGAAGLFPVGARVDPAVELATYRFAVREQAPLYAGTPMLSALLPVYAARLRDRREATRLLEQGYGAFIDAPYLEPDEFPAADRTKPKAAPMFAHIGGFLETMLFGFPGIRIDGTEPEDWPERPVVLPEGWRAIRAELRVRGTTADLEAVHGRARATLRRTGIAPDPRERTRRDDPRR